MKCLFRLVGVFVLLLAGRADAKSPPPEKFQLPSEVQTGEGSNDTIYFQWYAARNSGGQKRPAVVLLHALGGNIEVQQKFARYLSNHRVNAAVMELPYHYHRFSKNATPQDRFLSADANISARTWNQAFSNVSTLVTWLQERPDVDATRIGGIGVSLGAITLHGAMGRDPRIKAGVTFVGGGDFAYIYQHSLIARLFIEKNRHPISEQDQATLQTADPLTVAGNNHPRRVLMIQAARDYLIPPRSSQELWEALGRPPIRWVDMGHFGLNLAVPQARAPVLSFLNQAWDEANGPHPEETYLRAPRIYIPTVKAGLISGLDSTITPAVTVQVLSLGTRPDHLAWLHADVGLTLRGPYAGVAASVTSYLDVGIGRRLAGDKFRPYVGAQIAF